MSDTLKLVNQANSLIGLFADGEEFLGDTECQGSDTFRALDARNADLGLIILIVYDDIVAARINDPRIVQEVNVVPDIGLEAKEELGLSTDSVLGELLSLLGLHLNLNLNSDN